MKDVRSQLSLLMAAFMVASPTGLFAASHREAPITALDRSADITDYYSFVSYEDPSKVVFIMSVDPLLEPSNGPNYFPFDPNVLYGIHIDNTYDAIEDISFEFRFTTKINAPSVFTGLVGAGSGFNQPRNAPPALTATLGLGAAQAGTALIPPMITSLNGGTGAGGFNLQQTYTLAMVRGAGDTATRTDMTNGQTLVAVPSYVGSRTMGTFDQYTALAKQGIYSLPNGVRVFAGTTDDPFYIDLGAAFDSLNFRAGAFFGNNNTAGGIPLPVLTPVQDANDTTNYAPDAVAGFNVNTIAIEVPISLLTGRSGPVIGSWATTSRLRTQVRPSTGAPSTTASDYTQVQRMANPLINELIIGTGSKDAWSTSAPSADLTFATFALDPLLARVLNTVFSLPIPDPPRLDLSPLVVYGPPIAPAGAAPTALTAANPFADLLRLNMNIKATPAASRRRLGFIAGDSAGWPNGRRVTDDVTDIALRAVAGGICGLVATCTTNSGASSFSAASVPALGDGTNVNDVPTQEVFPYVAFANSGRDRRHADIGETVCAPLCRPADGSKAK